MDVSEESQCPLVVDTPATGVQQPPPCYTLVSPTSPPAPLLPRPLWSREEWEELVLRIRDELEGAEDPEGARPQEEPITEWILQLTLLCWTNRVFYLLPSHHL